jgi:hypothetical protein
MRPGDRRSYATAPRFTHGQRSSAIATDFGGGFITHYGVNATSELPGSAGIYTAGMSVIRAYNSTFTSHGAEGVMIAHDKGHTYLYDCVVTGPFGLNGHNSMGPEYSYLYMQSGTLNSTKGALITEMGGKSDMTLKNVKIGTIGDGSLIAPQSGRLIVNLENMKPTGKILRAAKSYLEVNLDNVKLTAPVQATKLSVDAPSRWKVTGESSVVNFTIGGKKAGSCRQERH